jgi:thioredoxin-dependent peroxiredoxin
MPPEVGDPAPEFSLPRSGGGQQSLKDLRGRKVVLYFYPKADTPGCTQEAMAFSALKAKFAAAGTDVIGVSADPVKAQDRFTAKRKLTTPLLSDETHEVLEAYGVWGEKTMFGRRYMGILRTTFLIDARGRVAEVWEKVKVEGHAEEVLRAARAL